VVSRAARITSLLGADILFYPTAIGWHPSEKAEFGQAQQDAWRIIQRSHAIANGVFVASPNRVGHEEEPGTDGIEFFGALLHHRSLRAAFSPRPVRARRSSPRCATRGSSRKPAATGPSCGIDGSMRMAPILSRYLGA
jgi:predicted amidohydrolase